MAHDNTGIVGGDGVIRRISEQQIVADEKIGGRRLSSMAFKASSGAGAGMSIDLQRPIEEAGHDARTYVTTPRWFGSIRLEAGLIRAEGFMVGHEPLPENPHHGEVWGAFTKPQQKRLREISSWFVEIKGVAIG